jgi:S1/P1 Nuclease
MKKYTFSIALLATFLLLSSWGFLAHRITPQIATYYLPRPMRAFFHANLDYLVRNSVRPDLRRDKDPNEAPRHYIDLEIYGDSAAWHIPERWDDAIQKYPADTLLKYGSLPWRVQYVMDKLTESFRNKQKDSILFYAADLCHYVGDGYVPLHTTLNYDGQLSNQKGIHALWESTLPEMDLPDYRLSNCHKATYLSNPQHRIWKVIRGTHILVKGVLEEEKKASERIAVSDKYNQKTGRNGKPYMAYSGLFAKAYSKQLSESVQQQLRLSAETIADFWFTAWVNAGRPDLSDLGSNYVKAQYKKERKSFKHNTLFQDGLLMAKKEGLTM